MTPSLLLPLDPLLRAAGADNIEAFARSTRISSRTLHRWQQTGLTVFQADRVAARAGFHPLEVWGTWDKAPTARPRKNARKAAAR